MNHLYFTVLPEEETTRIKQIEPFDEFEEWHLSCTHYILLTATKGSCSQLLHKLWTFYSEVSTSDVGKTESLQSSQLGHWVHVEDGICRMSSPNNAIEGSPGPEDPVLNWTLRFLPDGSEWCQRYAHQATPLPDSKILITGGFGQVMLRHSRIQHVNIFDNTTSRVVPVTVTDEDGAFPCERMYHTATAIGGGQVLLIGGRTSPTKPCPTTHLLTVNTDGDCTCTSSVYETTGSGPCLRWRHSAAGIQITGQLFTYVVII